MNVPTDIEKKNLEAHVELCAERYKNLDEKLGTVEKKVFDVEKKLELKMAAVELVLDEIKKLIQNTQQKRNNQLISWGVGIITTLVSAISFLLWHMFSK
jgi:hypothetical protein